MPNISLDELRYARPATQSWLSPDTPADLSETGGRTIGEYRLARGYTSDAHHPNVREQDVQGTVYPNPFFAGIELEIEGNPSNEGFPRAWVWEGDGSLRDGGVEVKTRRGLRGRALESAVSRMCSWLAGSGYRLSERCSTHIHVDVNDMNHQQLTNFLCLGVMLEPLLFRLFGNTRTANTFCMSTDTGTTNYDNLVDVVSGQKRIESISWSKYAGIGLRRILDFGTVEFRMFCPIVTEEKYTQVLSLLFGMKAAALTMESPGSLIDFKLSSTAETLFRRYFPNESYSQDFEPLLERGIQTLNDILTSAEVVRIVKERSKKYETLKQAADRQLQELRGGI